jgi:hypothetical protein
MYPPIFWSWRKVWYLFGWLRHANLIYYIFHPNISQLMGKQNHEYLVGQAWAQMKYILSKSNLHKSVGILWGVTFHSLPCMGKYLLGVTYLRHKDLPAKLTIKTSNLSVSVCLSLSLSLSLSSNRSLPTNYVSTALGKVWLLRAWLHWLFSSH